MKNKLNEKKNKKYNLKIGKLGNKYGELRTPLTTCNRMCMQSIDGLAACV